MKGKPESRMLFEALEKGPIAVLEGRVQDGFEVAHGLVVVNGEEKAEFLHVGSLVRFLPVHF
jgi:hypothetical protein